MKRLFQKLRVWWNRKIRGKTKNPKRVKKLRIEIMAKTATLTWQLPNERDDGNELLVEDIHSIEVEMAAGLDAPDNMFANIRTLSANDAQTVQVPELEPGGWSFRVRVFAVGNRPGPYARTQGEIKSDAPPAAVQNLQVTFE